MFRRASPYILFRPSHYMRSLALYLVPDTITSFLGPRHGGGSLSRVLIGSSPPAAFCWTPGTTSMLHSARFNPRTIQPVDSRYTDYATRPTECSVRAPYYHAAYPTLAFFSTLSQKQQDLKKSY